MTDFIDVNTALFSLKESEEMCHGTTKLQFSTTLES